MDSQRFDDLLRSLASGLSRRATIGAALSGLFASSSLGQLGEDADARKRRKKKKKKKCKGGTKKCGKKCIPTTTCCSSSDCGNGGTCANGSCNCASGFKDCNGACIADDQCCASCPGDTVCTEGDCVCPDDAPFDCPGNVCVPGSQCCDTSDCSTGQTCDQGFCICSAGEIACGALCCDQSDEICKVDDENPPACQAGLCPTTDFCTDPDLYLCANDPESQCGCATTIEAANACIDLFGDIDCNNTCTTDDQCGPGAVCIPGDATFCSCADNFCAPECGAAANRHASRASGTRLLNDSGGKRLPSKRRGRK